MASLGFQTVYRLLNSRPGVRCERAFYWDPPFSEGVRTMESGDRINAFDIVGFSLSYELDILNFINCLLVSGIPIFSKDRSKNDPMIVIGGAVAGLNPSPLLPFIDGLLVGEGEDIFPQFCDVLIASRKERDPRKGTLVGLSGIPGFFIPAMSDRVNRQTVRDLDDHPTYSPIVTPRSHFKDMFIIEVGRGCMRKCYFCAARKIYHPYRFRSAESLVETIARYNPGSHKIGLEGPGIADHPDLEALCESIVATGLALSISSFRIERLTPSLLNLLRRGGVQSVALAPEAGSARLRRRIGKRMEDEYFIQAAELLARSTIRNVKLYFLIGLPGETDEDIKAIVEIVKAFSKDFIGSTGRRSVRVSINAFIPKPFTEFQWTPMNHSRDLIRKRRSIQTGLKGMSGVSWVSKSTRQEQLQGVLSLADKHAGLAVLDSIQHGISWTAAMERHGVDIEGLLYSERPLEQPLPWEFIESHVPKSVLWEKYQRLLHA